MTDAMFIRAILGLRPYFFWTNGPTSGLPCVLASGPSSAATPRAIAAVSLPAWKQVKSGRSRHANGPHSRTPRLDRRVVHDVDRALVVGRALAVAGEVAEVAARGEDRASRPGPWRSRRRSSAPSSVSIIRISTMLSLIGLAIAAGHAAPHRRVERLAAAVAAPAERREVGPVRAPRSPPRRCRRSARRRRARRRRARAGSRARRCRRRARRAPPSRAGRCATCAPTACQSRWSCCISVQMKS